MAKKSINNPKERRDVFAGELREKNIDLALISNPKHIFYFSGFPSNLNLYYTLMKGPRSTSFLTIDSVGRASLLIGKGELSNQWTKKPSDKGPSPLEKLFDGEVTTYTDYDLNERMITYGDVLSFEFQKWIKKGGVRRMGIEEWHLPDVYRSAILSGGGGPEIAGISRAILSLRKMKGSDEIENLKAATGILDFAYKAAQKNARQGKTELDVYRKMNYRTFEKYGPFAWIIGDDVSGERTLEMGGWATDRRFKKSDTVILDLQTSFNNYWSDLCRTFVVGKKPSKKQDRVAKTLTRALEKAEEVMRPGTKGKEVYNAVNGVIVAAGYPRLPHHAGHSIGLDDQEPPWFIPNSEDTLEEGSVIVVEPGIYAEDTGGIRLEDAYVITKKGNERISNYPRDLT